MSTSTIPSPAEAQTLVERIARGYGWLSRSEREQTPQEALQAIQNLQTELGASVRTLATNLYRSNARFVFELIQNAEDNHYSRARARAADPYIKFTIRPGRIIVDSNEDGFAAANVEAICRIGASTKTRTGTQYYIGEKGIGFKSVFMVASKVHIQSGPFSFFFEHEPGGSGMGMITPEWEVSDEILPDPLTRMTLTLLDTLDYPHLMSQFDTLSHTLLFLNKLRKIIIDEDGIPDIALDEDRGGDETSQVITYSCEANESTHRATLLQVYQQGDEQQNYLECYHITRKSLFNLPVDERRDYNTAEVVLAFPIQIINGEIHPLVGSQEVYAYLPIRDFGFPFLIQSDFVTQASRQDIMEENTRNLAILDGVAKAFLQAVLEFCQHPTLQYQWMDYIPGNISDPFWSILLEKINYKLKRNPILRPRSKGPLKLVNQLKIVQTLFKDRDGNPLVADLADEMYLADEYLEHGKLTKLRALDVRHMNMEDFIVRLRQDIISSNSKMKSPAATDDWHLRVANILLIPFEKENLRRCRLILLTLPLIPLKGGEWKSTMQEQIFFPHTDGMPIPSDLQFKLIDGNAINNPTRKKLFLALGVTDASVEDVRSSILEKYRSSTTRMHLTHSVRHLHYLYWTHPYPPIAGNSLRFRTQTSLWIFNHREERAYSDEDLYFQTDDEYGVQKILRPEFEDDEPNQNLIFRSLGSFIHPEYLNSAPPQKPPDFPSWETWLEECLGILRHPRLVDSANSTELSIFFQYIIDHRREKLLGTLRAYWSSYVDLMNDLLKETIGKIEVPCRNIGALALEWTFLPLGDLVRRCSDFLDPVHFPFLMLNGTPSLDGWKFLSIFGVGMDDNLAFYLEVLNSCKKSDSTPSYGLYEAIQRKVWDSDDRDADQIKVRDCFSVQKLIWVPPCQVWPSAWTSPLDCLWDAPKYMETKWPLLSVLSHVNNPIITALFQDTLQIPDVSRRNLVMELIDIKRKGQPDVENIQDIYFRLQPIAIALAWEDSEVLRICFQNHALIYSPLDNIWAPTSSCLWSRDARIPGKIMISGQYEHLHDFFVGALNVKIPDLGIVVEELERAVRSSSSVEDVKSLIWQINSFEPAGDALEKLWDSPIFPVRMPDGTVELRDRHGNFSIVDRQHLADVFQDRVDFLDFSLKHVRRLRPFLSCLDLEGRCLSRIVVERSSFRGDVREPSGNRTRHLRRRAHALSRCATHFNSPRARDDNQSLYQLLLHAEVFETNGIIGSLQYTHNNVTVGVEASNSKLHIQEEGDVLKIYVPQNPRDQELCYLRVLPTKLFNETMMADASGNSTFATDPIAVGIIASVFTSSDEVIDDVLSEAGIVPVPYPGEFDREASHFAQPGVESRSQNEDRPNVNMGDASIGSEPEPGIPISEPGVSSIGPDHPSSTPSPTYQPLFFPFRTPKFVPQNNARSLFDVNSSQAEYRRLLNNVITAARSKRGRFPRQGPLNLDELLNVMTLEPSREPATYNLPFGIRNENQLSHDTKVGAAGELYAFEILSRLETALPGFGRHNWRSTIRRHVTVHEDYSDLEPWRGVETADITYSDTAGEFTKLLIENGYLDPRVWTGATPNYFLEAKTTTQECGTRFFLSKYQYQRMQLMRLTEGEVSAEIYIILRVFNLNKNTIDMRLYVDPKGMEENGELVFTPDSYSVLPSAGDIF